MNDCAPEEILRSNPVEPELVGIPDDTLTPPFKSANALFVTNYNNAPTMVDISSVQALLAEDAGRNIGECLECLCGLSDIPPVA